MIPDGVRKKIAVTMATFEYYYQEALKNKRYGKPECVADLLCKKLKEIMLSNVAPLKARWIGSAAADHEDELEDTYVLDTYHRLLVNDVLKSIRSGAIDFVFNPETLVEIYQHEPNLSFRWKDNVFLVWKENADEA